MKIGGNYQQAVKQLGRQHIQFMEAELQKRGVGILQSNVRYTLKFSGCWKVLLGGEEFTIKVSATGTALTYSAKGIDGWKQTTFRDFDEMVKAMQSEISTIQAWQAKNP